MALARVSKEDHFGVFFVRKPEGAKWDCYYNTLDALRPLLDDEKLYHTVSGVYLNVCNNFEAVRISYFVDPENVERAVSLFLDFFENNGLVEIKDCKRPGVTVVAESYGGEEFEERFRNFLSLETRIGLELLKEDQVHARILFATYRWQIRKAGLPLREHFEPTFELYSLTYRSLTEEQRTQFLDDLGEWPNPPQVDWAHMMVNFVLGCDWNFVFAHPNYLTPGKPLAISEINHFLREVGLQIPSDWKPTPNAA